MKETTFTIGMFVFSAVCLPLAWGTTQEIPYCREAASICLLGMICWNILGWQYGHVMCEPGDLERRRPWVVFVPWCYIASVVLMMCVGLYFEVLAPQPTQLFSMIGIVWTLFSTVACMALVEYGQRE